MQVYLAVYFNWTFNGVHTTAKLNNTVGMLIVMRVSCLPVSQSSLTCHTDYRRNKHVLKPTTFTAICESYHASHLSYFAFESPRERSLPVPVQSFERVITDEVYVMQRLRMVTEQGLLATTSSCW